MAYGWPTFPIQGSRLVSEFRGDYNLMLDAILKAFVGPDEPTETYPGMVWIDTSASPKLIKRRNTGDTAWNTHGEADVDYGGVLPLTGGTMAGAVDMDGYAITNLPSGSGNAPARYADLAAYAALAGATFTAIPILPAADPTLDNQAARKSYVDDRAVAGGSFTGQITLAGYPPGSDWQVARLYEVKQATAANNHDGGAGGPTLQGTNIGAAGESDGYILTAQGDNSADWAAPRGFELEDPPILVFDSTYSAQWGHTTPGSWKTYDLGAWAPTGARMARLCLKNDLGLSESRRWYETRVREQGSSTAYASALAYYMDYESTAGPWIAGQTFWAAIDFVNKDFDLALGPTGGSFDNLNLELRIYGWA